MMILMSPMVNKKDIEKSSDDDEIKSQNAKLWNEFDKSKNLILLRMHPT